LPLGACQHCDRVDVLPPGISNIDGAGFVLRHHQSDSVSKTAISVTFYSLEVIENGWRADKKTGIDSIVNR